MLVNIPPPTCFREELYWVGGICSKVSIKGDNVTPNQVAALRKCEQDYALKIKETTIYIRFKDHFGRTEEPLQDGHDITREFAFWKPRPIKTPQSEPQTKTVTKDSISARDM